MSCSLVRYSASIMQLVGKSVNMSFGDELYISRSLVKEEFIYYVD